MVTYHYDEFQTFFLPLNALIHYLYSQYKHYYMNMLLMGGTALGYIKAP